MEKRRQAAAAAAVTPTTTSMLEKYRFYANYAKHAFFSPFCTEQYMFQQFSTMQWCGQRAKGKEKWPLPHSPASRHVLPHSTHLARR